MSFPFIRFQLLERCTTTTTTKARQQQRFADLFIPLYNDKNTKWFCHTCSDNPFSKCKVTLPSPDLVLSSIEQAVWGVLKGSEITEVVTDIYSKIVKWKKNMFKVPTGKAGQDFIDEVAKAMTYYTSGSHFESVALTMLMIMFPLLLQKPSRNSKSKDHVQCLVKRLAYWRAGELQKLVKECTVIQGRLNSPKFDPKHHEQVFVRLMLQGKISSALMWIGSQQSHPLQTTDDVIETLRSKHPPPAPTVAGSTLQGPVMEIEDVIFDSIDADLIHRTAKKISGSAGPSGADAEIWQRILCSKQFKKKPDKLCECIAELAKKLCCKLVNPDHIKCYTACRLIPLSKNPSGVRPIGI